MPIMRVHAPRLNIANLVLNRNPGGSLFLSGDVCTQATVSLGRTQYTIYTNLLCYFPDLK